MVVVREDRPGDRRLVAYVVPSIPGSGFAEQLRSRLRDDLPGVHGARTTSSCSTGPPAHPEREGRQTVASRTGPRTVAHIRRPPRRSTHRNRGSGRGRLGRRSGDRVTGRRRRLLRVRRPLSDRRPGRRRASFVIPRRVAMRHLFEQPDDRRACQHCRPSRHFRPPHPLPGGPGRGVRRSKFDETHR